MSKELVETFSGAKVLITGHTGFKGSWLTLWLQKLGAKVSGISVDVPTTPSHFEAADIKSRIDDFRINICDLDAMRKTVSQIQPDFVFHLAAQPLVRESYNNPVNTWLVNTIGSVNVLECLRELDKKCVAVMITSDKCYDNVEWVWGYRETDSLGGPDPYSASKGGAELAIKSYVKSFFPKEGKVRLGVGRAGNVIGGGDWASDRIVPDCMRAWSTDNMVELRNPRATRPWQHVLEPLSGYLNLAIALNSSNKLHGEAFNFGPPAQQNQSVGELVTEMGKYWEKIKWVDISQQYDGPYESGLLKLNCDKALHHLSWKANWNFVETVRETVEWYKNYYTNWESVFKFSNEQIDKYLVSAKENEILWAL